MGAGKKSINENVGKKGTSKTMIFKYKRTDIIKQITHYYM